jgi:hypothetical protein
MLPETLGSRLEELRERIAGEPESLAALSRLDAALDELLVAHERAAELVPKLRECPAEVSDPPRPRVSPPWIFEEGFQLGFRAMVAKRVEAISPGAWLVRWDDTTYLSRVRIAGAPLVLSSKLTVVPAQPTTFRSTVRTSVPRATPQLEVRRERALDGVGRALGLINDTKVGDASFDERFVVSATPAAAALLTTDVTGALLRMEELGPRVVVKRGLLEIAWGQSYASFAEPLMPDDAIAVALGIRAAIERA